MSKDRTNEKYPNIPLSGLLQVSRSTTKNTDTSEAASDFQNNGKVALQQASLFYGGKITDKSGAFVQWTYDGTAHHSAMDLADIRYADSVTIFGRELLYGATVNNNPTAQDVWNSTPVWGSPYASSSIAVSPAAGTLIDGGLGSQVAGAGVYALWNDLIYAELSMYHTAKSGLMQLFSKGNTVGSVVKGNAPYWRVAVQHEDGSHYFSVGTYGMVAEIYPDSTNPTGLADKFQDVAFDAQYQYIRDDHIVSANTTLIKEKQTLNASQPAGSADNINNTLNTFRANLNYYYQRKYGVSAGYFSTTGSGDATRYPNDGSIGGSANGKPDSKGMVYELSYRPIDRVKLAVQYTTYQKFNGSSNDYNEAGRSASANNNLYLLAWVMF